MRLVMEVVGLLIGNIGVSKEITESKDLVSRHLTLTPKPKTQTLNP